MDLPLGPGDAGGAPADGGQREFLERESSFSIPEDADLGGGGHVDDDAIPDDQECSAPGSECRRSAPMLLGVAADTSQLSREMSESELPEFASSPCTHASAVTLFSSQEPASPPDRPADSHSFSGSSSTDSATLPADADFRARGPANPAGTSTGRGSPASSRLWPVSPHSIGQGALVHAVPATVKHGETAVTKQGFTGQGPFWTTTSASQSRDASRHSSEAMSSSYAVAAAPPPNGFSGCADISDLTSGSMSSRFSALVGRCVEQLAGILDVPLQDDPPPESELTTVLLETKEQRLQWRDFLSEAVSKSRANALYVSSDVDPLPGLYARPPPSCSRPRRFAGRSPPRVVAPNGAGWLPAAEPADPAPEWIDRPATAGVGKWLGDKSPRQPDEIAEEPSCEDAMSPMGVSAGAEFFPSASLFSSDTPAPATEATATEAPGEKAVASRPSQEALVHSLSSSSAGDQPARAG